MPLIADLDQLVVVGNLDIVGAHALEHVAEEIELPVGVRGGGVGLGACEELRLRHGNRSQRAEQGTNDQ